MYKTMAYINSLNQGKMRSTEKAEVTVLGKVGSNDYIVEYNGVRCHAIFNFFTGCYYADDIYGVVEE